MCYLAPHVIKRKQMKGSNKDKDGTKTTVKSIASSINTEKKERKKNESTTVKKNQPKRNEKGQFVKGTPKVQNSGRKQGTPNKYGNIRDRLKNIIMPYLNDDPEAGGNTLAIDLQRIDNPNDRVHAVAAILPFIVPKYSSTTISADTERPLAEEERLLELDLKYKKQTEISIKSLTFVDNDAGGHETPLSPSDIAALDRFENEEEDGE